MLPLARPVPVSALLSAALLLLFSGCGPGDTVEITNVRKAPPGASFKRIGASSNERFGGGPATAAGGQQAAAANAKPSFVWEMPEGWMELPPRQFRDINLQVGGHAELDCYMTTLSGDGGGLAANVNRWRGQVGLDPISDAAAAALPGTTLLGKPAIRVELSAEGADAQALLGVILVDTGSMVTVKLTGPAALVDEQRAGFDQFCRTLAVREAALVQVPPPAGSAVGRVGLTYDVPTGWTDVGASSMRIINLTAPGQSQCYVIRLTGEAGGRAANLNRWRGEVGLEAAEDAELDALPKVEFLGRSCSLLEVSGEYAGMGGQAGSEMTVLGVVRIGTDSSLFVKMVGPKDAIAAEKQRFIEFLKSVAGA